MKDIWKCDHCSQTNEDNLVMEEHEKSCRFNPLVKDCGSCKNNKEIAFSMDRMCAYGVEFEEDKTLPCEKWELEK